MKYRFYPKPNAKRRHLKFIFVYQNSKRQTFFFLMKLATATQRCLVNVHAVRLFAIRYSFQCSTVRSSWICPSCRLFGGKCHVASVWLPNRSREKRSACMFICLCHCELMDDACAFDSICIVSFRYCGSLLMTQDMTHSRAVASHFSFQLLCILAAIVHHQSHSSPHCTNKYLHAHPHAGDMKRERSETESDETNIQKKIQTNVMPILIAKVKHFSILSLSLTLSSLCSMSYHFIFCFVFDSILFTFFSGNFFFLILSFHSSLVYVMFSVVSSFFFLSFHSFRLCEVSSTIS